MPVLTQSASAAHAESDDFFLFRTEEPERAAQLCVELVNERIPRRFAVPSGTFRFSARCIGARQVSRRSMG